jgi:hypothetical protein
MTMAAALKTTSLTPLDPTEIIRCNAASHFADQPDANRGSV